MKDWKIVFKTRSYHYIFIKHSKDAYYLNFFYQHQYDIEKEPTFFFLIPTSLEIQEKYSKEYIEKCGNSLKEFMENPKKITLFAEEDLLKNIIKEDKRSNFFKYLSKKKKNIVLFCHRDLDQYADMNESMHTYMTREDLDLQLSLFQKFHSIKGAIKETHNPFKNPAQAFEKFQTDNN